MFGWNVDETTSFKLLDAFIDAGFNAVDTADSYSRWVPGHTGGESETVIGKWLKTSGKRDKFVIATKIGSDMGEGKSLRKDYMLRAAEASLKRLQVDCIDLLQTHFDDEVTPVEETLAAYAQLIAQGKVRAIGASNLTPARLKASLAASKTPGLSALREPAAELQSLRPQGLRDRLRADLPSGRAWASSPITRSPAASSPASTARSAQAAKHPQRGGKVKSYFDARGLAILKALDEVAARHEATPAQISLAWLMSRPLVTAPIASATSMAQLKDIMQAPQIKLSNGRPRRARPGERRIKAKGASRGTRGALPFRQRTHELL